MKKKYQIFVSSTYEDLKPERDLVIKAILEMGHIPVGMEMFSAGDKQQWKLIQTQIDDCDYYLVICAFSYGSLDGQIGYTEKEYDYAVEKKIPVLGFVVENGVSWPSDKMDKNPEQLKKLEQFKNKIKGKLVSFWKDKNDLYGKVSISLMKQFNTNPRNGWIKSTEYSGTEVLKEISRLSNENNQLRSEIKNLKSTIDDERKEEFQKTLDVLKHNKRKLSFYYLYGHKWENESETSLMEIFNILAPEIFIENSAQHCSRIIGAAFNPEKDRKLREKWPTPSNVIRKIFADLNVLGIIKPSDKKHSIKDENEYWTLTSEGEKLFKVVRRELLDNNMERSLSEEIDDEDDNKEAINVPIAKSGD